MINGTIEINEKQLVFINHQVDNQKVWRKKNLFTLIDIILFRIMVRNFSIWQTSYLIASFCTYYDNQNCRVLFFLYLKFRLKTNDYLNVSSLYITYFLVELLSQILLIILAGFIFFSIVSAFLLFSLITYYYYYFFFGTTTQFSEFLFLLLLYNMLIWSHFYYFRLYVLFGFFVHHFYEMY